MLLSTLLRDYLSAREVSREYGKSLTAVVLEFGRWLKRSARVSDFSDAKVNAWLTALVSANGRSRSTLANKRRQLLTLWRYAWQEEHAKQPPRKVRRISVPAPSPAAWDTPELRRVIAAARCVPGKFRRTKIERAKFWEAFVRVGYSSGLRLGDLVRLRWEQIRANGIAVVSQHKTGNLVLCPLDASALAALEGIRLPHRSRVFGDCLNRRRTMKGFIAIVRAAGLTGGSKMLRRSGATAVAIASPGWESAFLGHVDQRTARHYVDRAMCQQRKPTPPPID